MRRALAWLIDGVPLDPRSRRAVDETLADWAQEEQEEQTQVGRVLVDVRGAVSLVRVTSFAILRETVDLSWCRGLGRRCVSVFAAAGIVALGITLPFLPDLGAWAVPIVLAIVPVFVYGLLPAIVFLVFAWRPGARWSLPSSWPARHEPRPFKARRALRSDCAPAPNNPKGLWT